MRLLTGLPIAARLALLYGGLFGAMGVGLPFWPLWLSARGLDAAQIGIALAVGQWTRVAGNLALAPQLRRWPHTNRPLTALAALTLLSTALFTLADGFAAIVAATALASFCAGPLVPLSDSLTVRIARAERLDYGRIRVWGSLAFILAAAGGGWVLAGRAPALILTLLLIGQALTLAACLPLPEPPSSPAVVNQGLRATLGSRRVALFLLAASLVQASHGFLNGFASLHWQAAGHGKATIGWLWAAAVIIEMGLFVLGGRLIRRLGARRLLWLAAAAGVLRWSLAAATTALPVLVVVQALHALTFAATHLAAMDFLGRESPVGLASAIQTLFAAIVGAAMGLSMLLAGALYEDFGGGAFLAMSALSLAAMPLLALSAPSRPAAASP